MSSKNYRLFFYCMRGYVCITVFITSLYSGYLVFVCKTLCSVFVLLSTTLLEKPILMNYIIGIFSSFFIHRVISQ